ncbi:tetratricopeptide (TPR) repeat protein [Kitasatospora sp. MAP12-15]|uniref:hypothetical protein n=1 Tax=unclassified Kitasatospora TaxID=2633591 RepID=UPI002474E80A|nr:hypothetical protein [Kitasatospora sp. MAP12-44]MDH6111404.1 tetratricopeptide (TPR) repeat protein [Kitasatospora sp. MAP12-44]
MPPALTSPATTLTGSPAELAQLLACLPVTEADTALAAWAFGATASDCERWYAELAELGLVEQVRTADAGSRYRRTHALEQATGSPQETGIWEDRVQAGVGWLAVAAFAAAEAADVHAPGRASSLRPGYAEPDLAFTGATEARRWLDANAAQLPAALEAAAAAGRHRDAWRIGAALCAHADHHGDIPLWLEASEQGLAAAQAAAREIPVRLLLLHRTAVLRADGRFNLSLDTAEKAIKRASGALRGRGLYEVGATLLAAGRPSEALEELRSAWTLLQDAGDRGGAALTMLLRGAAAAQVGEGDLGEVSVVQAREQLAALGHARHAAWALAHQGRLLVLTGRQQAGDRCLAAAAAELAQLGAARWHAQVSSWRGEAAHASSDRSAVTRHPHVTPALTSRRRAAGPGARPEPTGVPGAAA